MRPLRLEVEGFTCYRDRQPALEFSELDAVRDCGADGRRQVQHSGRDAVCALWGGAAHRQARRIRVHLAGSRPDVRGARLPGTGPRLQSHASSKQSKNSVKTDATLAELTAAGERSIASQVKQVNEEIVTLLGLGYDEFIQTVVLPQGEFAKFLKAKPADQRSILQHLLRHDVFTRMRDLAEDRRREMDAELRGLDGKLSASPTLRMKLLPRRGGSGEARESPG